MIEMLIVAMILSGVTLKAAGNAAVDVAFAVRGKESPRLKNAKARSWTPRRPSGPAFRYFSQLWTDSWEQRLAKHNSKVADGRPEKPRGAARVFWSGVGQDARRAGRRYWDQGWTRLDEKRRSRSARVPDGTDVVPGEVVPEPPVPAEPEPVLRDQPDGSTDLQFGTDPTDPTGTTACRDCGGRLVVDGEICAACQYRQKLRNEYHEQQDSADDQPDQLRDDINLFTTPTIDSLRHRTENYFEQHPEERPLPHPTQEGTPTMTAMPTTEVVGLDQAISYCDASAVAHREQIVVIERTMAALDMGDVSGPAAGYLAQAMEANATCQTAMENASAELAKQKAIQEQYDAVQGAGTREFITGGR
ncbi:MAG TPA: hypothetical protein VGL05_19560 [Kribbella sp.]